MVLTYSKKRNSFGYPINCQKLLDLICGKLIEGKRNIVIMDIDGTILNNLPRQTEIINVTLKKKYCLPEIPNEIKDKYKKYYNILDHTEFSLHKPQNEELKTDFLEDFLSNDYLNYDTIIPGADKFVKVLIELGLDVFYLTGRHDSNSKDTMKPGTESALNKYGIGTENGLSIELFMKPDKEISDLKFKMDFLSEILHNQDYNLIALIDNESKTLNEVKKFTSNLYAIRFNGAESSPTNFNGIVLDSWI